MTSYGLVAALMLVCTASVQAQFGSNGGGFGSGSSNPGSSSSSDGFGFGGLDGGVDFDVNQAMRVRAIHGILAAVAFVVLFPIGSILMRVVPGRLSVWIHACTQIAAYCIYIAAAGMGLYLVHEVQLPFGGGSLLSNSNVNYHPIIGIIILVALFFQPILGIIHHARFKKLRRRQVWSYLHLFNGRIMVMLGIINGGLGLYISGASSSLKTAYAVVAAVLWALWMLTAVFDEFRRWRAKRKAYPGQARPRRKLEDNDVRL